MSGHIYRQRRRIAVAGLATMLAVGWQWQTGVLAMAAAGCAVIVAVLITLFAPVFRRSLETAGLGLLFAALLPGPVTAILPFWILLAGFSYYLLYGRWADKGHLRLALTSHRTSRSRLSRSAVWAALIPGEAHPDDHWTGTLIDFDRDPDDPETLYLRFECSPGVIDECTLSFLDRRPQVSCRYLLEQDRDGFPEDLTMTITLTDLANGQTDIATIMDTDCLPPRIAFARWFDDAFGDELDRFAATIQARRVWAVLGAPALPRWIASRITRGAGA